LALPPGSGQFGDPVQVVPPDRPAHPAAGAVQSPVQRPAELEALFQHADGSFLAGSPAGAPEPGTGTRIGVHFQCVQLIQERYLVALFLTEAQHYFSPPQETKSVR